MEKTIYFYVLISLIFTVNVHSQVYYSFPDSNAIWNEYSIHIDNNTNINSKHRTGIIGDTTINSITYSKLYSLNDTSLNTINSHYECAIREEDKKVYVVADYFGQEEILLYDFSKNVGDTIRSNATEGYMAMSLTISIIDSIEIFDGSKRKHFWFEQLASDEYWIEGIGSISGLLSPIYSQITNYYSPHLSCFKQDDKMVYLNNYSCSRCFCGLSTDIIRTESSSPKIEMSSNSTTLSLNFGDNNKNLESYKVSILNQLGQILKTVDINCSRSCDIPIDNLSKGVYIVMITNCSQRVYSNKLIKN